MSKENVVLPDHIYYTLNSSGSVSGYRVLYQNSGKVHSKSFALSKYADALSEAINHRNEHLNSKRSNCTTGVTGVVKASFTTKKDWPNRRYCYHAIIVLNGKQYKKSFTYAVENTITGVINYDADLEFKAFLVACHFRHLMYWYKRNGLINQSYYVNPKLYPNLKNWRTVPLNLIFSENKHE